MRGRNKEATKMILDNIDPQARPQPRLGSRVPLQFEQSPESFSMPGPHPNQ